MNIMGIINIIVGGLVAIGGIALIVYLVRYENEISSYLIGVAVIAIGVSIIVLNLVPITAQYFWILAAVIALVAIAAVLLSGFGPELAVLIPIIIWGIANWIVGGICNP